MAFYWHSIFNSNVRKKLRLSKIDVWQKSNKPINNTFYWYVKKTSQRKICVLIGISREKLMAPCFFKNYHLGCVWQRKKRGGKKLR